MNTRPSSTERRSRRGGVSLLERIDALVHPPGTPGAVHQHAQAGQLLILMGCGQARDRDRDRPDVTGWGVWGTDAAQPGTVDEAGVLGGQESAAGG